MAKIVSSFNTTLTPTNRYGFCRIPDGNSPLGSIVNWFKSQGQISDSSC